MYKVDADIEASLNLMKSYVIPLTSLRTVLNAPRTHYGMQQPHVDTLCRQTARLY